MIDSDQSDLHVLQTAFRGCMLGETDAAESLLAAVKQSGALSPAERCAIYRDGYRLRLQGILAKDFPKVRLMMGEEQFARLTERYIQQTLSHHFSISGYGAGFADFMVQRSDAVLVKLADLARLDWAITSCIESADATLLQFSQLAEIAEEAWPDLTFSLHPSVQAFVSEYDVVTCWQALDALVDLGQDTEAGVASLQFARLQAPALCLVWRGDQVFSRFMLLMGVDKLVFELIQKGLPFAEVCEQLCESLDESIVAATVIQLLRQWIDQQLFTAVRVCESSVT